MKTEFKLDFAIIGTQKGGTTSAMNLLGRFHPNVKIPRREMSFLIKIVSMKKELIIMKNYIWKI